MVADTIANVRGWTTGHCSGSDPKPRDGVRGGAPPSVRSLGWVEDSIDGSCARKILVTACGFCRFETVQLLPSHSLRHQRCCSGGGGLHFLCWLGLVSPLMCSPLCYDRSGIGALHNRMVGVAVGRSCIESFLVLVRCMLAER